MIMKDSMIKKTILLAILSCINIYCMDNIAPKYINEKHIPYMEVIKSMYEDLSIDFSTGLPDMHSNYDQAVFEEFLSLLEKCIDVVKNKPVGNFTQKNWIAVYDLIKNKNYKLPTLIEMLNIINFFDVPILLQPICIITVHKMVNLFKLKRQAYIYSLLDLMPTDLKNTLKFYFMEYYPMHFWKAFSDKKYIRKISMPGIGDNCKVLFTPNKKYIIAYNNNKFSVMTPNNKILHEVEHLSGEESIFAHNNKFFICLSNNTIKIWYIVTGLLIKEASAKDIGIKTIHNIYLDDEYLIALSGHSIALQKISENSDTFAIISDNIHKPHHINISPDRSRMTVLGDKTVVFDLNSLKCLSVINININQDCMDASFEDIDDYDLLLKRMPVINSDSFLKKQFLYLWWKRSGRGVSMFELHQKSGIFYGNLYDTNFNLISSISLEDHMGKDIKLSPHIYMWVPEVWGCFIYRSEIEQNIMLYINNHTLEEVLTKLYGIKSNCSIL